SACSPRKRGDLGAFSSGYWTVNFFFHRCRPVTLMPLRSSNSVNPLTNRFTAFIGSPPSLEPVSEPGEEPGHAYHADPYQRHRDEHLPAQAHDLVVAIARKRRPEPQEEKSDERKLDAEPDDRRHPGERCEVERRVPAAEEHDHGERRDQDHVGVL